MLCKEIGRFKYLKSKLSQLTTSVENKEIVINFIHVRNFTPIKLFEDEGSILNPVGYYSTYMRGRPNTQTLTSTFSLFNNFD